MLESVIVGFRRAPAFLLVTPLRIQDEAEYFFDGPHSPSHRWTMIALTLPSTSIVTILGIRNHGDIEHRV